MPDWKNGDPTAGDEQNNGQIYQGRFSNNEKGFRFLLRCQDPTEVLCIDDHSCTFFVCFQFHCKLTDRPGWSFQTVWKNTSELQQNLNKASVLFDASQVMYVTANGVGKVACLG